MSAGGILQGLMFPLNLGRFGNSIAIWLGIQPYELFFYIFLPPLLFDAAVRIDIYLFKKVRPWSSGRFTPPCTNASFVILQRATAACLSSR